MTLIKRRENMFPTTWNDLFNDDFFRGHSLAKSDFTVPAVNIKENTDNYAIELAVPGKKKEDFNIELDNDLLTISSEDKSESTEENKDENYTKREFRYSSFSRSFTLPDAADGEKISANYKDGVLNVIIHKKDEAKVKAKRMIEIS
ncbi:MAG: Hsp20/alpha crystallin family protein [Vicingaceae bacterium]|nr:Hsp20/alpha crystallin family protein [Vicingaceae bacterium]